MRMKSYFFLAVILAVADAGSGAIPASSKAATAFEKLKTLVGDWQGKDGKGEQAKTSFKLVAGNTAVSETLEMSGMDEMLTLYSIDGDTIALLHYCPTNNQPRMRSIPEAGDIKQLVFSYLGAGNLPSIAVGHEHKLVIQFEDKDHITE